MPTVLTTTERHRPGSLRDSVRRLFARASNNQSASRPGMFDRAQNTSIQNAIFTINQYGALAVDPPPPGSVALAQTASGSTTASSRAHEYGPSGSPRPRRESPDVYVDCLMTESRGYPLWIPSPNRSLPTLNRTLGVSVGDVGVLTLEGGFDFVFNIFYDATHPINAAVGVPDTFIPFTPVPAAADIQQFVEWNAGSFLADASIDRVDDDGDRSTTVLEATGTEGAVLMIPENIHTTKLKMTIRLRKYVKENIAEWYRFVKHTLGHDIENGDLRVVYGCRKSSGFGIATAFNTGRRENTRLTFSVEGPWTDSSRCPYRWSHTGSAEVKAGPSGEDHVEVLSTEPVRNQCLFVNTIDARVSAETWKYVELNTVAQMMPNSTREPNSGERGPTAKSGAPGSMGEPSSPCRERAFHPSGILQNILETITPGLPAYIVCDDDWAPFVSDRILDARGFVDQILEKRMIFEDQGMMFFCTENDIDLFCHRRGAHIRFNRISPIDNSSDDSDSHWKAERRVSPRLQPVTMDPFTLSPGRTQGINIPVQGGPVLGASSLSSLSPLPEKEDGLITEHPEELANMPQHIGSIQRDLGDIIRNLNTLVERAVNTPAAPPQVLSSPHQQHSELLDPFATNSSTSTLEANNTPLKPPNQAVNGNDISSISQRLDALVSSVGQLIALQLMQAQDYQRLSHPTFADSHNSSVTTLNTGLGNGLPKRLSSIRQPNTPLRTLSSSQSIMQDLPMRPILLEQLQPGFTHPGPQRRSTPLSVWVNVPQGDHWAGSAGGRDDGHVIFKWEQLALAPELLRSLAKFGVGPQNKIQQRTVPFLLQGVDMIAQAPPTQERTAAYVIPAIQVAIKNLNTHLNKGPLVVMVSTTIDQVTQAQRIIHDLGGPIGVKSALCVGTSTDTTNLAQELQVLQQDMPHIICGTPQKLHALFTAPGGVSGAEVRFLVLDEVDQLIARNLHEFVFNIVKLLPPPRSLPISGAMASATNPLPAMMSIISPGSSTTPQMTFTSPCEPGSPVVPASQSSSAVPGSGRRFSSVPSTSPSVPSTNPSVPSTTPSPSTRPNEQQRQSNPLSTFFPGPLIKRQTAIFSNTVPQDVLNLANQIHLREPVRVLVRREGNVSISKAGQGSTGLRQYYLYLAFTADARSEPKALTAGGGLGVIGPDPSASRAETTQVREWKLDALADIFEQVEVTQAIVHVGGMNELDAIVDMLASRGVDAIALHSDMNNTSRVAALIKFRDPASSIMRQPASKALVIYDVQLGNNEVSHVPLVINYDLPKAVEEYSHRVSSAIASNQSRAGVVINFVTATGGDVEMLRSIEIFFKIKCPEVPMNIRDIL
ncbi:hypothetical protein D9619_002402 [Psilocybe cf. subviscida]|uniref:RNA helicase n=1 Tax=Psilocybe cf. subviscida TaxID=2480587 RepID=A0A8H5AWQ1_9AGAR|nr:hypothetical protein D9619_002402 [Psilocybe cf. subviscida]